MEDRLPLAVQPGAEVGVVDGALHDQIDREVEQAFQAFLQREVGVVGIDRGQFVERDQDVEIAAPRLEVGDSDGQCPARSRTSPCRFSMACVLADMKAGFCSVGAENTHARPRLTQ